MDEDFCAVGSSLEIIVRWHGRSDCRNANGPAGFLSGAVPANADNADAAVSIRRKGSTNGQRTALQMRGACSAIQ
jgi:hypothetical protein